MYGESKQPPTNPLLWRSLSHPRRTEMLGYLIQHGGGEGPDEAELAGALGLTGAEVRYHLTVLRKAGLVARRPSAPIAPRSRAFLVETFTDLRDDLADQVRAGGQGCPDPEKAAGELATYEALLAGLTERRGFPDDEAVRHYVSGLAKATDEENQYEQARLEHLAFAELVQALAEAGGTGAVPETSH